MYISLDRTYRNNLKDDGKVKQQTFVQTVGLLQPRCLVLVVRALIPKANPLSCTVQGVTITLFTFEICQM